MASGFRFDIHTNTAAATALAAASPQGVMTFSAQLPLALTWLLPLTTAQLADAGSASAFEAADESGNEVMSDDEDSAPEGDPGNVLLDDFVSIQIGHEHQLSTDTIVEAIDDEDGEDEELRPPPIKLIWDPPVCCGRSLVFVAESHDD